MPKKKQSERKSSALELVADWAAEDQSGSAEKREDARRPPHQQHREDEGRVTLITLAAAAAAAPFRSAQPDSSVGSAARRNLFAAVPRDEEAENRERDAMRQGERHAANRDDKGAATAI
jgi:hypothetical protein